MCNATCLDPRLPRLLLMLALMLAGGTAWAASMLPYGVITLDGQPAPPLQLQDIDGRAYDLQQSRGHWVFVHFWASWCGPCRQEMPTVAKLAKQIKAGAPEIVLINTAESEDTVFSFLGIVAPELTPLLDSDGQVTERWQPRGLPSTFLVDPQGKLRYLVLGGRDWTTPDYLRFIQTLAATPP